MLKVVEVSSQEQLEQAYEVRTIVFVEEQGVALEREIDEYEEAARHLLVMDGEKAIGASRWRQVGEGLAKLERICVLASHRHLGVGRLLVEAMERSALAEGLTQAKLHGQVQAAAFYERLGYTRMSEETFLEEDIPHYAMTKELK